MQCPRLFRDYRQVLLLPAWRASRDCPPVHIVGSTYPCLYYGFFCDPYYQLCYLLLFTAAGLGE